jgi:hypothetical protein
VAFTAAVPLLASQLVAFTAAVPLLASQLVAFTAAKVRQLNQQDDGNPLCMS